MGETANRDGATQSGELSALSSVATSISLDTSAVNRGANGNWIANSSSVEGTASSAASVYFAQDVQLTQYIVPDGFEYCDQAAILPKLKGYGTVKDLSVAISEDSTLLADLESLVRDSGAMSAQDFRASVEDLVKEWVGVADPLAPRSIPTVAQLLGAASAAISARWLLDPADHPLDS